MKKCWVQYSCALVGTYIPTSVPQVTQVILPIAYSGEASHEGTVEVDDLCKLKFLCCPSNITTCYMLSIQPRVFYPKQNSSLT